MARSSPNQRFLDCVHKEPRDKEHIYAAINKEALFEAMRSLPDGATLLWIYFASQSDSVTNFAISPTAIEQSIGMKKKQYDNAMTCLIERGYLVEVKEKHFEFYEKPSSSERIMKNSCTSQGTMKNNTFVAADGKEFEF